MCSTASPSSTSMPSVTASAFSIQVFSSVCVIILIAGERSLHVIPTAFAKVVLPLLSIPFPTFHGFQFPLPVLLAFAHHLLPILAFFLLPLVGEMFRLLFPFSKRSCVCFRPRMGRSQGCILDRYARHLLRQLLLGEFRLPQSTSRSTITTNGVFAR